MTGPLRSDVPSQLAPAAATRREPARAAAIFVVAFALFALFPTHNFNYADDSMSWAYRITRTVGLINVHHLFMNGMRVLYHALVRIPGLVVDPARLLALYSALFGALGLVFLDALLRMAGLRRVALLGTLVCAATLGYWTYNIVGDVYVPAAACLLGATYWYCRGLLPGGSPVRHGVLAALALVVMLLHHQAFFLFAGALLPAAFALRGGDRRRFVYALAVTGSAAVAIAIIYLAVYVKVGERVPLRVFLSGYASHRDWHPDQMQFTAGAVVRAVAGEARALLPTNLLFRSDAVTQAVQARFPYRNVYPYPFLMRNLSWPVVALGALAAALATALGLVLVLRGVWVGLRARGVLAVLFAASLLQCVFFVWWEAISDEFWIWSTPVVACAAAAGAASLGRRDRLCLGLLAAGLGVGTFVGAIVPYSSAANDLDAINVRYLSEVGARDLVVGFDEIQNSDRALLAADRQGFEYFNVLNRARTWSAADDSSLASALQAASARGGRVFVDPYLVRPPLSNLASARSINPSFDVQREGIVERLAALPPERVVWVPLAAEQPGYFAPAPAGFPRR